MAGRSMSLAEALAQGGEGEFEFNPLRIGDGLFKAADLG